MEEIGFYFRSALSATCVVFGFDGKQLKVLLHKKPTEPMKGHWSLPGEMVYPNEEIEQKVDKLILSFTGLTQFYKKQIRAFADTSRHPLGRVIGIGYYAFVDLKEFKASDDTNFNGEWFDFRSIPDLAFDHNEIVAAGHRRLLAKMTTQLTGFELLPEEFTLSQLQNLYEGVLGLSLDKRNFRRKVLSHNVILDLDKPLQPYEGSGKAPMLHKLDRQKYNELKAGGYRFDLF